MRCAWLPRGEGFLKILVMTRDLFYLFYYCWKRKEKGKRTQQAGNRTKRGLASFSSFYFFPVLYLEASHASSCFFPLSGRVRAARVVDLSGDRIICPCTFTIAIPNWTELRVILEVKKRERGLLCADGSCVITRWSIRPNQSFLPRGQMIRYSPGYIGPAKINSYK